MLVTNINIAAVEMKMKDEGRGRGGGEREKEDEKKGKRRRPRFSIFYLKQTDFLCKSNTASLFMMEHWYIMLATFFNQFALNG